MKDHPRLLRATRLASVRLLLAMSFLPAACGSPTSSGSPCRSEPLGSVNVFADIPGGAPLSVRFAGALVSITHPEADGPERIAFRDSLGAERAIALSIPGFTAPLVPGRRYSVLVEAVGGAPTVSGIVVSDSTGLVFAGASDQNIGAHVLKNQPPGWEMSLVRSDCESRGSTPCLRSIMNSTLRITHGGRTDSLSNGQSVVMDGYRVVCLTAQHVEYEPHCADAGVLAVSWLIARDSATVPR